MRKPAGRVIWLTGLSGAGKSTLAERLQRHLVSEGRATESLDGDQLRKLFPQTGFTKQERDGHVKRVGYLASLLEKHGVYVIVSLISPYREARDFARSLCERFTEVYVSTPLEVCEKRDTKGLYGKARKGQLQNFTGVSDPYEAPLKPEVKVNTVGLSVEETFKQILKQGRL